MTAMLTRPQHYEAEANAVTYKAKAEAKFARLKLENPTDLWRFISEQVQKL